MKTQVLIISLFVAIIYKRIQALSTLKTLVPHPQFRAGTFSIPTSPDTSISTITVSVMYSSALSSAGNNITIQPIVGLFSMDFAPSLYNFDFLVAFATPYSWSNRLQINLTVNRSRIIQFTFTYFTARVPNKSFYRAVRFTFTGPYYGPAIQSNAYVMDLNYPSNSKVINFITSLNVTSPNPNSFQFDQSIIFNYPNEIAIQINIKSGYTLNQVAVYGIIIDQTGFIAALPTGSTAQCGIISTTTNALSETKFTSAFQQSLIIGLRNFWYSNGKMVFDSILSSTNWLMQSQNFNPIEFSYILIKYMGCPATAPYFKSVDNLCYDDCQTKYFQQPSTKTCQSCLPRCEDCLNGSSCSLCDASDNRQLVSNDCVPKTGFFQTGVEVAQPCQSPCATCQINNYTCLSCISDFYYFDGSNNICTLCGNQFPNCNRCATTGCLNCASDAYYLDVGTNICTLCGNQYPNCNRCTTTGCLSCISDSYYFDGSNNICTLCGKQFPSCNRCTTLGCLSCIDDTYYFDPVSNICTLCGNEFPNCNRCSTNCNDCNPGYILVPSSSMCETVIPCSSFLKQNGCIGCSDTNICYSCDQSMGYYLTSNNDCSNICGDSILNANLQQCEDGNTDNMDGCSSSCIIEQGFSCPISVITNINECTYLLPINFTINSLYKIPQDNKVKALMTLSPILKIFENYNFQSLVSTDLPVSQYIFTYDKLTGTLQMIMKYTQAIDGKICTVTIDPPHLGLFLATPASHLMVTMSSTDHVPFNFYEQSYYELSRAIFYASIVISILAWVVFFIGSYYGKIIGIQTLGVVQLTFIAMLSFPYALNPCLKSLSGLSFSNGINIFLLLGGSTLSLHTQQYLVGIIPLNYRQLQWNVSFLQNYNLSALFVLIPLLVSLAIFITIKIKERKKNSQQNEQFDQNIKELGQRCYKFLFQITLVGLILTQYIFFSSMGVQLFYGFNKMELLIDYASVMVLILLFISYVAYFILFTRDSKKFGEFNTFYSQYVNHSQKLINYIMIQRLFIGLVISIFSSPFALVLPIALTVFQFVIVFTKKPYSINLNNYRSLANLSIQFLVLAILLGLSLAQFLHPQQQASSSPMQTSPILFYAPLIITVLLFGLIVQNFIILIIYIRSAKEQANDKIVLQKQILDLNKERMKAYEMSQFMPSPFLLLREQLDRSKNLHKNVKIKIQHQTVIGQISPSNEAKGHLLNKEVINQMFQEKIEQNVHNQQEQFNLNLQKVQYMRNLKQQLAKPMNDIQLAQQWQKIDQLQQKKQQSNSSQKTLKQQQLDQENLSQIKDQDSLKYSEQNSLKSSKQKSLKSRKPAQEESTVRFNIMDYENL